MKKFKVQNAGKSSPAWFTGLLTAENIINDFGYEKGAEIIEEITIRKSNQFSYGLIDYLESEAFQIVKNRQLELIKKFEFGHKVQLPQPRKLMKQRYLCLHCQ